MFRSLAIAGLAAASLAGGLGATAADAQPSCQQQRSDNRLLGTILGAGAGALLGNAIGEHGGKLGGTIIGGVGGAVAGNAIGGASIDCRSNRYGYYDDSGRWVPNTATAYGYYDANGRWIETPAQPDQTAAGPFDTPAPASPTGAGPWAGAPDDTRGREAWLQDRIQERVSSGSLDEPGARRAIRELDDIRRIDADYRGEDGRLNTEQRQDIDARLESLRERTFDARQHAEGSGPN